MKTSVSLLLALLAASPAFAATKRARKGGDSAGLPPKWSSLIQPATVTEVPSGLITSEMSGKDLQFLSSAIESGQVQIWLCKTAKDKGEAGQVRAVGDALESTQVQENTYLSRLAAKKGLALPPLTEVPNQKKISAELGHFSGEQFDKEILTRIIASAQGAVTSYEGAAQSGDGEIKSLAERLLPVAKDKLLLASRISTRPLFRTGGGAPPAIAAPPAGAAAPTPAAPKSLAIAPAPAPAAAPKPAATPAAPAVPAGGVMLRPLATPVPAAVPAALATPAMIVPPQRPAGPKPVPSSVLAPPVPVVPGVK